MNEAHMRDRYGYLRQWWVCVGGGGQARGH